MDQRFESIIFVAESTDDEFDLWLVCMRWCRASAVSEQLFSQVAGELVLIFEDEFLVLVDIAKTSSVGQFIARIDGGMFYIVEGEWNQDFLDEIEQFPNCTHDDQIDGTTVLWEMLAKFQQLVMA